MTQEEKQLLFKDLSARLPYGVMAHASEINKNGIITDVNISYNMVNLTVDNVNGKYELVPLFDIKPYLRPLSSMTEEELKEYSETRDWRYVDDDHYEHFDTLETFDWLNAHHFDYRGLIEKRLALEAPEGMYKEE